MAKPGVTIVSWSGEWWRKIQRQFARSMRKNVWGVEKKGIEYIEKMKGWGAKAREAADKMKGSLWVEKNWGVQVSLTV